MDDSKGWVSSQPQPTISAQMSYQPTTEPTTTCFQPGPSWPGASRRSVVVVEVDMAASLGVAPGRSLHPQRRIPPGRVAGPRTRRAYVGAVPTVAESIVIALADHGVTQVWGVVGDALNPVTEAIRREERI